MTSSSDTFPFGIADVVELLGLTVRRRLPSSLYLNCPFCGDLRGRLNVNTDKNVWRCNRCGAAGGMLALYARYNCTGNADAYREICEALGRYTPRPRVNDCIGVKPEQNIRATPQEIHQTYSLLLSMLPLTPTHKAHLLSPRRGLTDCKVRVQIDPACVSVPQLCRASAAAWLHLAGCAGLLSRRCRAVDDQLRQPHGGHPAPGCRYGWFNLRYADTAGHAATPQG